MPSFVSDAIANMAGSHSDSSISTACGAPDFQESLLQWALSLTLGTCKISVELR